ncbi:MAG: hypothetical protein M3O30_06930 [Planctomycetota bacterium]|nr:hypothetical protein [Planctomycetota bacterium]
MTGIPPNSEPSPPAVLDYRSAGKHRPRPDPFPWLALCSAITGLFTMIAIMFVIEMALLIVTGSFTGMVIDPSAQSILGWSSVAAIFFCWVSILLSKRERGQAELRNLPRIPDSVGLVSPVQQRDEPTLAVTGHA